jgi:hypothetical protein
MVSAQDFQRFNVWHYSAMNIGITKVGTDHQTVIDMDIVDLF